VADEAHIAALGVQHHLLPLAPPAHCEIVQQKYQADQGNQRDFYDGEENGIGGNVLSIEGLPGVEAEAPGITG
jgi:hypothetical protein